MLASVASAPPHVKKKRVIEGYIIAARRSASSIASAFELPAYPEQYANSFICLAAASASSLRPCPSTTFHSPDRPSRYSLPSASVNTDPAPRTHTCPRCCAVRLGSD